MKDLVKGFVKWFIIVLLTLNVILWVSIIARCQTHPKHDSIADVEDTAGFISVKFLSKDDRLIYWKREMKREVKLSSFGYDKYTKFVDKLEGDLCILYCKTHSFAYIVTQCKE